MESIEYELLGNDHKQRLLLEQFRMVVQNLKLRINTGFSAWTVKNWAVTELLLQELPLKHYLVNDIAFKQLDIKFHS